MRGCKRSSEWVVRPKQSSSARTHLVVDIHPPPKSPQKSRHHKAVVQPDQEPVAARDAVPTRLLDFRSGNKKNRRTAGRSSPKVRRETLHVQNSVGIQDGGDEGVRHGWQRLPHDDSITALYVLSPSASPQRTAIQSVLGQEMLFFCRQYCVDEVKIRHSRHLG